MEKVLPVEEGSEILSQLLLFINLISILIQSGPNLLSRCTRGCSYYGHAAPCREGAPAPYTKHLPEHMPAFSSTSPKSRSGDESLSDTNTF